MNFSDIARYPGSYHLNGPFARCMGDALFGQWIPFVNRFVPCADQAPAGGVVDGPPRIIWDDEAEEMAVAALMVAVASLTINVCICLFICARRDYEELDADVDHLSDDEGESTSAIKAAATSCRRALAQLVVPNAKGKPEGRTITIWQLDGLSSSIQT
eukprot:CAMPEP_0178383860 /NCGR_PEP_ID=MMETSP0689_2-20121128/7218_1 /TAXON_ID=160604 /ORGANISM="Amphidinium massartii, Strain CS-259" /LENGTH=157 /DNA_ID=CAMNT_0020004091 /DNA_START=51 /DNA_END=519 /DNA_ORIENTATION=+